MTGKGAYLHYVCDIYMYGQGYLMCPTRSGRSLEIPKLHASQKQIVV